MDEIVSALFNWHKQGLIYGIPPLAGLTFWPCYLGTDADLDSRRMFKVPEQKSHCISN